MSEQSTDHPDPEGFLLNKHDPSGDCANKTEQVVQDAKEAVEAGDLARAFHYIARFGDRGVGNYTTEELLHRELDEVFGSTNWEPVPSTRESAPLMEPLLETDGESLADYRDVMRSDWTLEDDGLEQLVNDAWPSIDGRGPCAPLGWIAVDALVEVLQLDVEPETEREVRLVLETAETVIDSYDVAATFD